MTARYCHALSALAAGLVASAPLAPLAAQVRSAIDPNAPVLVVEVFRSADKTSGVQAADAIRTRISQDVSTKQLWVRPKQDITNNLESSGFPVNEALNMNDAKALAQLLRGDMFIVGNVVKDSAGVRVEANYVLTRDAALVQPLGVFRVNKPDQAAGQVSKAFQEAQKAYTAEKNCVNRARDQKYAEAIAEAKKGIAAYPNTTLARICLANVLVTQKAAPDSILAVTSEILKIDPRSKPALAVAYQSLADAKRPAEATDMLLRLVAADPSNTKNVEAVVNELAGSGQAAKAVPFVDQLVRDNAGDPNYMLLQMRVHFAAKDFKGGLAAGDELLRADTAQATAELFTRLAAAAASDSQPQKAAQYLAQGVAKFPTNADLLATYVEVLRSAGQNAQALEMLNKMIAANPKQGALYRSKARIQADMNQPDSAVASLQAALAAGDSASSVALYALSVGQTMYRAANGTKTIADYEKALSVLDFAVKTNSTPDGQLLLGAAQLSLGGAYLTEAQRLSKEKKPDTAALCSISKKAQSVLGDAQSNVAGGGKSNPQTAQQLLGQLTQFSGYADQFAKAFCK